MAVALAALINYYTEGGAVPTNFSGTSVADPNPNPDPNPRGSELF